MPDILLFVCTFGFLSGVCLGWDIGLGIGVGVPLISGVFYFSRLYEEDLYYYKYILLLALFFVCGGLGYIRYIVYQVSVSSELASNIGHTFQLTGKVATDPSIGDGKVALLIYKDKIGFRVSLKTKEKIEYGDQVSVSGTLTFPENFMTDQGTEFDYVSYLKKDRILVLIPDAKLLSHERARGYSLYRALYSFRHQVEGKLFQYVPEKEAGLLAGILVGTKTSIDESLYNALVRTSTVHIVALSGFNVSIVTETISKILGSLLPPLAASLAGMGSIILFVVMTGASSTAIRAGFMAVLMILSKVTGRPTHIVRVMALAALILVFINPMYLVADASFQLSFLATLGLILVSPPYIAYLEKRMHPLLAEAIGTTLAAETAVAPFILYKMGVFSVVALPINVLIAPAIPLIMLGSFVVICTAFFSPFFAPVIAYPSYLITTALIGTIQKTSEIPFASITIPSPSLYVVLGFYTLVVWYFTGILLTKR
jgi:competence protein ComEC